MERDKLNSNGCFRNLHQEPIAFKVESPATAATVMLPMFVRVASKARNRRRNEYQWRELLYCFRRFKLDWFRNFSWLINFIHYSRTQSNLPEPAIEMAKESDCPSKDTTMAASKRLHGNQPACWSMINDLFSRRRVTIRFEGGDRCRRKVEILERLIAAINTSFLLYYFLTNFKRQIMSETGAGTSRVSTLYPSPWPSRSRAVNY